MIIYHRLPNNAFVYTERLVTRHIKQLKTFTQLGQDAKVIWRLLLEVDCIDFTKMHKINKYYNKNLALCYEHLL